MHMTARHRFETKVQVEGVSATYFEIPLDVRALFTRARPPGPGHDQEPHLSQHGGGLRGPYFLPLNKTNREAAGVAAGDVIEVDLQADEDIRSVDMPADLASALEGSPEAQANQITRTSAVTTSPAATTLRLASDI